MIVGLKRVPELRHCPVEPGVDGANRDPERLGHILKLQVEVVAQDDDRPLIDVQFCERPLQLVASVDGAVGIRRLELADDRHPRNGPARPSGFVGAGADEESIRPGLKAGRITQPRQLAPDAEEGDLCRVLGEVWVSEDPIGHRTQTDVDALAEGREGGLVSPLRANDQFDIHTRTVVSTWSGCL